jgi:GNAT superfamily N-acetyltransferase
MTGRISIRFATAGDAALILDFVRELAHYERASGAVVATEADLVRYGFGPQRHFEAILAFLDGEPVGFALFYPVFSTWLGRPGMFLEDLYVRERARRNGIGRALLSRLAAIAVERGYGRLHFNVLDWNPAKGFYERLGMAARPQWQGWAASEAVLRRLAQEDRGQ